MTQINAGEPTPAAVALTRRMDRSDAFRAAHTLTHLLDWGGYRPDVIDVLRVAEFLTDGECE